MGVNGRDTVRPRGKAGQSGSTTSDLATIAGAIVQILRPAQPAAAIPVAPLPVVAAPVPAPPPSLASAYPLSSNTPPPPFAQEMEVCLADFYRKRGLDFTAHLDALNVLGMTPDVIPGWELKRLMETMVGVLEGHAMKFVAFCKAWSVEIESKRNSRQY